MASQDDETLAVMQAQTARLERLAEESQRATPRKGNPRALLQAAQAGLGLAIARALAKAHGSTLTAGSEGPGRGATFTLKGFQPP